MPDELADAGGVDPGNGRSCPRERPDERLLPDGGEPDSNDVADPGTDSNPDDSGPGSEPATAADSNSTSNSGSSESENASEHEDEDGIETPPVETDGEGVVNPDPGAGTGTGTGKGRGSGKGTGTNETHYPDDDDDDIGGLETPPDDEEMPLADHIEEMVLRLAVVLLFGAAGTAVGLLWASDAIAYIWADVFPTAVDEAPPHVYHPLELWLTRIKLSALLGIMVALPTFVYECYLFMKPGLYPHERKYYLAAVPTSVVLGAIGMLFSYQLVLPVLFQYFTYYAEGSAEIAYALGETFSLVITLTGFLAVVFQIPLFIMLAIMMGVTTRRWLAQKRLYFWAAFAGLAFMFTFDPSGMAPILVAITMILLFEGTLAILKWVGTE